GFYRFEGVEEVLNSGNVYYAYSFENTGVDDIVYGTASGKSIPQFGWVSSDGMALSDLFFAPQGSNQSTNTLYETNAKLRYVTDADNNILYEKLGGIKLWELTESGVADAVVEGESSDARWFTLDGRAIVAPNAAGIYIRQTEKGTNKVVIR
ncbi:MAG: hypothetical protein K2N28_05565, partial [Muribaculaceae bacterium]|nr:hypothetical protein [Muribaculaceae bacterium]